jgi:hypothetical protein
LARVFTEAPAARTPNAAGQWLNRIKHFDFELSAVAGLGSQHNPQNFTRYLNRFYSFSFAVYPAAR